MANTITNWTAHINHAPGDNYLLVEGFVEIGNTAQEPILIKSPHQEKSFDLELELHFLGKQNIGLAVIKTKKVTYKVATESNFTGVTIYDQGKLLHHIDNITFKH